MWCKAFAIRIYANKLLKTLKVRFKVAFFFLRRKAKNIVLIILSSQETNIQMCRAAIIVRSGKIQAIRLDLTEYHLVASVYSVEGS